MPDLSHEASFHPRTVCGIDEAGRGPWAGPVIAACAYITDTTPTLIASLNDSKKLSRSKREMLFDTIMNTMRIGVGEASAAEIDTLNIWKATELAMQRAYHALGITIDIALVDGNRAPALPCTPIPLIKGDGISASIAAASIIAKVTRDRKMYALDNTYKGYGFAKHAGYGTKEHHNALLALGPCPEHRKSFAPVKTLLVKAA